MGLGELLDRIRGQYVVQFTDAIELWTRQPGVRVLSEVVLRNETGEAVGDGELGLPLRLDLAVLKGNSDPQRISVDSNRHLSFDPIEFFWPGGLEVDFRPFHWDCVSVRMPKLSRHYDNGALVQWFSEWFRVNDDGDGDLLGVIHDISGPASVGEFVEFTVDLGSAPVEAFEGLLDACAALGTERVTIGGVD